MKKSREQFLGRDERAELEVARTEGSFVFDAKGKRYIDFMMGWCVGNFGWGNARKRSIADLTTFIPATRTGNGRSSRGYSSASRRLA